VILTNQIVASSILPSTNDDTNNTAQFIPALGTSWAHQVNTRLSLKRHHASASASASDVDGEGTRSLVVTKSAKCPSVELTYLINQRGLSEIETHSL
jgi:hypothetical protein